MIWETTSDLTVTLYDGREVKATLLFKDPHKDLSILQIALKTKTAIRLSEGRNLLGMGETIFSVGCPSQSAGNRLCRNHQQSATENE